MNQSEIDEQVAHLLARIDTPEIRDFLTAETSEEEDIAVRSPVETARDDVRRDAARLTKAFRDVSARLAAGIALKTSLRKLEQTAARYGYERLSRVAAVLH